MADEYEKVINENMDKYEQIRLVISSFKGVSYIQFRKYYLDFENEWVATKEGVSMEMTIENVQNILSGILEVCSIAEAKDILNQFQDNINAKQT